MANRNKNSNHKDYIDIEKVIIQNGNITDALKKAKPALTTCNRLLYFINKQEDRKNYIENVNAIINYVDAYRLEKDRGYFHSVIQSLVYSDNLSKQEEYASEMKELNIKTKVSTFIPLIETAFNIYIKTGDWNYYKKAFQILQQNIIDEKLIITDELFIIMFRNMSNTYTSPAVRKDLRPYFIQMLSCLAKYKDVININIFNEMKKLLDQLTIITKSDFVIDRTNEDKYSHILECRQLGKEDYQELLNTWDDKFKSNPKIKRAIGHAVKHFKFHESKLLNQDKPIIIIDGANVGYFINRKRDKTKLTFYQQIDSAVQYFKNLDWNVVVFLYHTHIINPPTKEIETYVNSWKSPETNVIRYDVTECQDDIIWLAAGFYYNIIRERHDAYVLTNDMMRDHHDKTIDHKGKKQVIDDTIPFLDRNQFFQWRDRHLISYDINYSHSGAEPKFTPEMPVKYSHFTQSYMIDNCGKSECDIYIPVVEEYMELPNERTQKADLFSDRFRREQEKTIWNYYKIDMTASFS